MPVDITVLIFAAIIVVLLDILALATDKFGWSLFGMLAGLTFTAFMISGDGLVTISSVYNINTSTWIHNTQPLYPYFVIGFGFFTLISMIITIAFLSVQEDGDETAEFA